MKRALRLKACEAPVKPKPFSIRLRVIQTFLFAVVVLFLVPACTGEPPEILRVFWRLNLIEDREQNVSYQSLSLFVKPSDPDGFEDIEEVYLLNDEQELLWHLDGENWVQSGSGEELWIGSNSLRMPAGSSFPGGIYRVLLRDVGGDSAEQEIRIESTSISNNRRFLPAVNVRNGRIEIAGALQSYQLWLYDTGGRFVTAYPAGQGSLAVEAVIRAQAPLQGGFSFKVYGYVPQRNLGVISGPYYVTP
jgi:hypothetical protein